MLQHLPYCDVCSVTAGSKILLNIQIYKGQWAGVSHLPLRYNHWRGALLKVLFSLELAAWVLLHSGLGWNKTKSKDFRSIEVGKRCSGCLAVSNKIALSHAIKVNKACTLKRWKTAKIKKQHQLYRDTSATQGSYYVHKAETNIKKKLVCEKDNVHPTPLNHHTGVNNLCKRINAFKIYIADNCMDRLFINMIEPLPNIKTCSVVFY